MSTDYITDKVIPDWKKLREKLAGAGMLIECPDSKKPFEWRISDPNDNYLWAYPMKDGSIDAFTRYGGNDPVEIISVIEQVAEVRLIDEYDDEQMDIIDKRYPEDEVGN